jgi:hypothetical protein
LQTTGGKDGCKGDENPRMNQAVGSPKRREADCPEGMHAIPLPKQSAPHVIAYGFSGPCLCERQLCPTSLLDLGSRFSPKSPALAFFAAALPFLPPLTSIGRGRLGRSAPCAVPVPATIQPGRGNNETLVVEASSHHDSGPNKAAG